MMDGYMDERWMDEQNQQMDGYMEKTNLSHKSPFRPMHIGEILNSLLLPQHLRHTFSQESPIVGDFEIQKRRKSAIFKSSTNQKENPDESQCLATLEYVCKTYT